MQPLELRLRIELWFEHDLYDQLQLLQILAFFAEAGRGDGVTAGPARALGRVMTGETGDDQGNREIAQYHLGIAYFRLRKFEAALAVFADIASRPMHLKFSESELWLSGQAEFHYLLARCYQLCGSEHDARTHLDLAQELPCPTATRFRIRALEREVPARAYAAAN